MEQPRSHTAWFRRAFRWLRFQVAAPVPLYSLELEMHFFRTDGLGIRTYTDDDFESCLALYQRLAPGRFPKDDLEAFQSYLKATPGRYLLIEREGRLVACGGLHVNSLDHSTLVYGLVDPPHQGCGLGRLLLYARLAQIPVTTQNSVVSIFAVESSIGYYQKYGFVVQPEGWKDSTGQSHPWAVLGLTERLIKNSRSYLKRLQVAVPDLTGQPLDGWEVDPLL